MLDALEVCTVIESLNACAIFAQQAIETYRDIELPDLEANLLKKGIMISCFDIQDCIRIAINPRTSQADLIRICQNIEELICIWQTSEAALKIRLEKLFLL